MYLKQILICFLFFFISNTIEAQNLVDYAVIVKNVAHNYECCNDDGGICGFTPNSPEPRYRVRARKMYLGTPGPYSAPEIINLGTSSCGSYSRYDIVDSQTGVCANQIQIEVEMWEEDCGSDISYNGSGCSDVDDSRTFTLYTYSLATPGSETITISGAGGYAISIEVIWSQVSAPTVTSSGTVCPGELVTLTASGTTIPGATYNWYETPSSPTSLFTGNPYELYPETDDVIYLSYVAAEGCKTTPVGVVVDITEPVYATETLTVCDEYTAPSGLYTWTSTGTYNDTIPSILACDSVITFDLTVLNSTTNTIAETACDEYLSPAGNTYTSTGIYEDIIPNAAGCDSIITIDLVINTSTTSAISETACDSYESPSGSIYTSSAIFTEVIPNVAGCDSTITIDLTIEASTDTTIFIDAIDSYTSPSGTEYTSGGVYTDTISNAAGCDSVITINLHMEFTGISDVNAIQFFYPNPANQIINFHSSVNVVSLYSMDGKLILTENNQPKNLSLSALPNGIYWLELGINGGDIIIQKVVIEH